MNGKQLSISVIDAGLSPLLRQWGSKGSLKILCYHGIWLGPGHYGNMLFMRPGTFAKRLAFLRRHDYEVISLDEGLARWQAGDLGRKTCVITIDDGWYGTYRHMLPLLEEHGMPATLYAYTQPMVDEEPVYAVAVGYFLTKIGPEAAPKLETLLDGAGAAPHSSAGERVLSAIGSADDRAARLTLLRQLAELAGCDWDELAENRVFHLMTPEELDDSARRGLDIQLHTHNHTSCIAAPGALAGEIEQNRAALSGIASGDLTHFCYPSGEYNEALFPILKTAGIVSATTTEQGHNAPSMSPLSLRRLMDGEAISEVEFSAELSGAMSALRKLR